MVLLPVLCPNCGTDNVRKNGHDQSGKQRFLCDNAECPRKTFGLQYTYNAYKPEVRASVYEHTVNGNGTLATARLLGISKNTVTALLKKPKT